MSLFVWDENYINKYMTRIIFILSVERVTEILKHTYENMKSILAEYLEPDHGGDAIVRSRLLLLAALLTIMVASVAGADSSRLEENTRHRIKSISGLPTEEAERLMEKVQELLNPEDYIYFPDMLADVDGDGQEEAIYEYASVMVADVDGDSQEEAIAVVSFSFRGEAVRVRRSAIA